MFLGFSALFDKSFKALFATPLVSFAPFYTTLRVICKNFKNWSSKLMYIQIIKAVHVFKNCPKIRNGQKELRYCGVICTHFSAATKLASQT